MTVGICRSCKRYHDFVAVCLRASRIRKAEKAAAANVALAARCWYCGASGELTRDHVIPKSAGGDGRPKNIVPACKKCNHRKGNLTLDRYRWALRYDNPNHKQLPFFGEQYPDLVWAGVKDQ